MGTAPLLHSMRWAMKRSQEPKVGPDPLVEHVDHHQGCVTWSRRVLSIPVGADSAHGTSVLASCDDGLMEYERKTQDAFLTLKT